jgi:2,4-dienoyl-CoA reductase-like NADH-dependent reductase (Old Yellow Enzyme family)
MPMMIGEQYRVTNRVVGAGMHSQRMATLDAFDLEAAEARAKSAAGITSRAST